MNLFLNLAAMVVRIVLSDAGHSEGQLHTWIPDGGYPYGPWVKIGGVPGEWCEVTIYDRYLSTSAVRYYDGTCARRNRAEFSCVDMSDLLGPA